MHGYNHVPVATYTTGLQFTKRMGVLPQDLVKSRSREIGRYNDRIALEFDRHLGSAAAEVPVTFQSDCKSLNMNLAAPRVNEILRWDVRPLREKTPRTGIVYYVPVTASLVTNTFGSYRVHCDGWRWTVRIAEMKCQRLHLVICIISPKFTVIWQLTTCSCCKLTSPDKMAASSQTTFSNAFSMKSFIFWCEFHWSLFLRDQLTMT